MQPPSSCPAATHPLSPPPKESAPVTARAPRFPFPPPVPASAPGAKAAGRHCICKEPGCPHFKRDCVLGLKSSQLLCKQLEQPKFPSLHGQHKWLSSPLAAQAEGIPEVCSWGREWGWDRVLDSPILYSVKTESESGKGFSQSHYDTDCCF